MDKFIGKLNTGPTRFGSDKLLKDLPRDTRNALLTFRDTYSEKKVALTIILLRFYTILRRTPPPQGYSIVRNGFFLYGGQVIQKMFETNREIIDPKVAEAMDMVPSSDFDGQLLVKIMKNGKILSNANISKCFKLKNYLTKTITLAMEPYKSLFKLKVESRTPFTIDITLSGKNTRHKYLEIHASNAYYSKSKDRLKQTKCCVKAFKPMVGLPILDAPELLYDQLFALDSMLTGDYHRKEVRKEKCQSRFVRLTFLYEYLRKNRIRVPTKVKKLIQSILYRMDRPRYQKYFKKCTVKIH
jgi:hypothetical protein